MDNLAMTGKSAVERMAGHVGTGSLATLLAWRPMLRMLLDQVPPGEKLGAVRYVSSGTAPLPSALREQFEERRWSAM